MDNPIFWLDEDGRACIQYVCNERRSPDGKLLMATLPRGPKLWRVVTKDPLTVAPSIHCVAVFGGCGLHGFIRKGTWVPA